MNKIFKLYQRLSINAKVIVAYIGFVVVIGGAGTLLVFHNEKTVLQQQHIALARNLSENVQPFLLVGHKMMLNQLVQIVGRLTGLKTCAIIDRDGTIVAHTDMALIGKRVIVGPEVRKAYREKGYFLFQRSDHPLEGIYVEVVSRNRYLGSVLLTFPPFTVSSLMRNPGRTTRESILIVILFVVVFGLIGAVIIAKLISYPMQVLTRKIYDVFRGKFPEKRIPRNAVLCWEQLDCHETGCPSYLNRMEHCWTVAGTFCRGKVQGVYAQKIGDCRKCIVYKKNAGDELAQLNDGFDIMVRDLLYNAERMKEAKEDLEEYARQLERANRENIDLKIYNERIINSLSSAVISLDENLIIRKYNQAAETILGADLTKLIGKNIVEVEKTCTRCNKFFGLILEAIQWYQKEGSPLIGQDVAGAKPNGEAMTISLSVLPLFGDTSREKTPIIVVFEDITEKEKMREELALSRHLAELGEVAAKVAHDIRNPLNAIEGGVHYLISKYREDHEIQNVGNLVKGQVERLNNVTSDLLEVSKPMTPNFNVCDLNRVADEATSFLLEEIRLNGLELEKQLDRSIPPLCIDPNQIQRAIINLMQNAIEAMEDGGILTLLTRNQENGRSGRCVELAVRDQGPGISDEILDSIFKPFYTTKLNGTGLGLSIVRQIISQHQGEIIVRKSEPGPGTEVILQLPVEMRLKDRIHV